MYDDDAFCRVIKEKGLKIKAVADAMGIKTSTLYRKRHGESDFLRSEIQRFGDFVGTEYVDDIFFAQKVS
jgi:predicted transcriptional regulator